MQRNPASDYHCSPPSSLPRSRMWHILKTLQHLSRGAIILSHPYSLYNVSVCANIYYTNTHTYTHVFYMAFYSFKMRDCAYAEQSQAPLLAQLIINKGTSTVASADMPASLKMTLSPFRWRWRWNESIAVWLMSTVFHSFLEELGVFSWERELLTDLFTWVTNQVSAWRSLWKRKTVDFTYMYSNGLYVTGHLFLPFLASKIKQM